MIFNILNIDLFSLFQLKAQFDQERIAVIYVDNDNDEVKAIFRF